MVSYSISKYTYDKANLLNVFVFPSNRKYKKIDVYNSFGDYICSIGDIRYKDYPWYLEHKGEEQATMKANAYWSRHKNDKGKAGYYAKRLLW